MSTMVERVAQAARARAAIAAMREPTEEMIEAWIRAPGAIKGGWQGMIDAALEGPLEATSKISLQICEEVSSARARRILAPAPTTRPGALQFEVLQCLVLTLTPGLP